MYAIKPATRKRWTDTLEKEYHVEESNAETLIDLIVGDPRVTLSRPQTESELQATVDSVRTVINEMDLTEFGEIDDHDKLRDTLVGMLRQDLDLHITGTGGEQNREETAVANQRVEGLGEPTTDEPPVRLVPFIDQLVEKIENEDSEFDQGDVREMARWVIYNTQDRADD